MSSEPNGQPTQAFQSCSTEETIHIPTITDPQTGQSIILWRDVQDVFDNAQSIRSGESPVAFLKDENSRRIMPLRIPHHPGVVLKVIESADNPTGTSRLRTHPRNDSSTGGESDDQNNSLLTDDTPTGSTHTLTHAAIQALAKTNTDIQSLSKYSQGMSEESQSCLSAYSQLYDDYCNALMLGQEEQVTTTKRLMDEQFEQLQVEMEKNKELQEQLVKMQKQVQELLQQTKEELTEKHRSLDDIQQQTLTRLTTIRQRGRDLLLQGYELHESSIPRLFIILPKPTGPHHKLTGLESEQFRLYFLCECGTHTMTADDTSHQAQHKIHLAKHEGYDLVKPTEFFEKYGSYLLAMMYIVKYGAIAAALKLPAMGSLKTTDDSAEGEDRVEHLRKDIARRVDDTINYLHEVQRNSRTYVKPTTFHTDLENLETLRDTDLRDLKSYLKIQDKGCNLGKLYRIATQEEGHIKWVCLDHYRTTYQESHTKKLRGVTEVYQGTFTEELGRVEIRLPSKTAAKQFYDEMVNAGGVQELDVTLEWDASMDDLRTLAKAVTMANLISLTVDGSHLKGPKMDIMNRSRRFNPIIQLGSNGRLQHLGIRGFHDFFSRVSKPPAVSTSTLRMLSVEFKKKWGLEMIGSFVNFLGHCPSLVALNLKLLDHHRITVGLNGILYKLPMLESLEISQGYSFTAKVSERRIQDMTVNFTELVSHVSYDYDLFRQGCMTQISIGLHGTRDEQEILSDILYHNPTLTTIRVGCYPARVLETIDLVVSARVSLQREQGFCQLRTLEVMEVNLVPMEEWSLTDRKNGIHSRLSFAEDSPSFDMVSWVRLQNPGEAREFDFVCDFIREYGWSVVSFKAPWIFTNHLAGPLNEVIDQRGSRLETLDICPFALEGPGLYHLENILEQSPCLIRLHMSFMEMQLNNSAERAQMLLHRFGEKVTELTLSGDAYEQWLPHIASSFPTRDNFPNLICMTLEHSNSGSTINMPTNCLPWIVAMISSTCSSTSPSPPTSSSQQQQPLGLSSSLTVQSPSPTTSTSAASFSQTSQHFGQPSSSSCMSIAGSAVSSTNVLLKPLTTLVMTGFSLRSKEWKVIIEAIHWRTLQRVSFHNSNFGEEQFRLLVEHIPEIAIGMAPLKSLDIRETDVVRNMETKNMDVLEAMFVKLGKKVPLIQITY
ncbi:hypothetical protein B0O80DRAFT_531922 [Mortierella sp. GBAus27b]|nr:hypothetical protein BGX31_000577 [Mortierella sp. GBA43]KAI8349063.1 hypothetical protein B0O80DRAFT_531922 [Mortierella sp. GBAus27b]